jgi:hypothetical protein
LLSRFARDTYRNKCKRLRRSPERFSWLDLPWLIGSATTDSVEQSLNFVGPCPNPRHTQNMPHRTYLLSNATWRQQYSSQILCKLGSMPCPGRWLCRGFLKPAHHRGRFSRTNDQISGRLNSDPTGRKEIGTELKLQEKYTDTLLVEFGRGTS